MTSGLIESGGTPGYYRRRQWTGNDGMGKENAYAYSIKESWLPAVKYKAGASWINSNMGIFLPSVTPLDGYAVDAVNRCTNKVWGELAQTQFNAGVFAGEFRESYHMVSSYVRSLALAIASARRGRWDRAFRLLAMQPKYRPSLGSTAANSYMMFHFGVLPMLNDIGNIYDLMVKSYKIVKRIRCVAGYKEEQFRSNSGVVWRYHFRCLAEIRGEVSMVELSVADRLSLSDIPTTAWELTKLSWLIDWLLPIGNFLSAVNAHNKTSGQSFCLTRMQEYGVKEPTNTGMKIIQNFDGSSFQTIRFAGVTNGRTPMTQLPWTFPTIKNPLGDNLSRWVTSVALLRQSVGR